MLKKAVYVWQAPIRIYHWLNVFLITVLIFTGLYIGNPIFAGINHDNYISFLLGRIRLLHALAAWIFIGNFIFRLYWAFAGNEYAKFKPWRKGFLAEGVDTLKYYLFLKKEHTVPTGHNVIAQLTYFFIIWVGSMFMILTGLALQGEIAPGGFQERFFGWMIPIFRQSHTLRMGHHIAAWFFIAFIAAHLYLVIRQELLDDDGTVSSIFSGFKFVIHEEKK